MKLYLIRHGQTDWNVQKRIQGTTDIELNDQGISQAKELCDKVLQGDYQITRVYSSKQKRAKETARILGEALGVDQCVEEGLHEMNLGEWEGLTWKEVKETYPKEYKEWYENRNSEKAPGGESYEEVLQRALNALRRIAKENKGNVAVVTHGAVILCLKCFFAGIPVSFSSPFRTENTSIFELDGDKL